jgi:tetratricopeptide (TPR) repeat protein
MTPAHSPCAPASTVLITNNMTAPVAARRSRLVLIACCLTAATAAALVMKWTTRQEKTSDSSSAAAAPGNLNPEAWLATLPPARDTNAGKLRAVALTRIRTTPLNATAWCALGDALAQESRDTALPSFCDHAEKAYREASRLNPAAPEALIGISWVFGQRHQFDESIAWAQKALDIRGDHPDACGIIGDAALELGRYDEAFDHYQKMMDLRPDLSSWSRGAHLLWLTGDKSKAMWLMEKAIRAGAPHAENTAWCRARLAMMLFHDGAFLPASQALEPALTAGTQNPHLLIAAAKIAAARDAVETARKHCEAILKNGPHHEALALLGDLCANAGDKEGAEKFYRQVEDLHRSHTASGVHDHMTMAKFLADHDRNPVEALRLAEQAKLTRNVTEADVLAWVYFKNGDLPSAIAAMKRALSQNTPDAELRYHAGMIAAAAGDRTSAQKHLQAALTLNSRFSVLHAPLAFQKLESIAAEVATSQAPPR